MNVIKRIFKAFYGLILFFLHRRQFDLRLLNNKRIALIGPANSAYGTGNGSFIDSFDYVVRINKAPLILNEGKFKSDIGTRTDILFHSFFENDFSGGGPLNFKLYDSMAIQYVINPIPTLFGKRATFNFYKKYLLDRNIYELPKAPYKKSIKAFGKFRPTTGFCAIKMAMEADFSELFISGFTFFKTSYGDGYRDSLKDVATNKKYILESNIHNPDIEYEQFKQMIKSNNHKRIIVDDVLKSILERDGVLLNQDRIDDISSN